MQHACLPNTLRSLCLKSFVFNKHRAKHQPNGDLNSQLQRILELLKFQNSKKQEETKCRAVIAVKSKRRQMWKMTRKRLCIFSCLKISIEFVRFFLSHCNYQAIKLIDLKYKPSACFPTSPICEMLYFIYVSVDVH